MREQVARRARVRRSLPPTPSSGSRPMAASRRRRWSQPSSSWRCRTPGMTPGVGIGYMKVGHRHSPMSRPGGRRRRRCARHRCLLGPSDPRGRSKSRRDSRRKRGEGRPTSGSAAAGSRRPAGRTRSARQPPAPPRPGLRSASGRRTVAAPTRSQPGRRDDASRAGGLRCARSCTTRAPPTTCRATGRTVRGTGARPSGPSPPRSPGRCRTSERPSTSSACAGVAGPTTRLPGADRRIGSSRRVRRR